MLQLLTKAMTIAGIILLVLGSYALGVVLLEGAFIHLVAVSITAIAAIAGLRGVIPLGLAIGVGLSSTAVAAGAFASVLAGIIGASGANSGFSVIAITGGVVALASAIIAVRLAGYLLNNCTDNEIT